MIETKSVVTVEPCPRVAESDIEGPGRPCDHHVTTLRTLPALSAAITDSSIKAKPAIPADHLPRGTEPNIERPNHPATQHRPPYLGCFIRRQIGRHSAWVTRHLLSSVFYVSPSLLGIQYRHLSARILRPTSYRLPKRATRC